MYVLYRLPEIKKIKQIYNMRVYLSHKSLEFIEEMRILTEMKIKNCGENNFPWGKN